MKKILIIGSNSFAGSDFIDFLLDKNYKVYGVSRKKEDNHFNLRYKNNKNLKNFQFHKINLNSRKDIVSLIQIIKKNKITLIANFAAQGMVAESWINPEDWYLTNVVSNSILIKELSKLKIEKYLNFSTPEVYGNTSYLMKESDIFAPTTPYAISRSAQDFNLLAHFKAFGFPVVFTRAANIYGPYQQSYRIIPKIVISILTKKKIPIHGKGNTLRSFVYMPDVSKALYKILLDKKNLGQTFHISTKKFISILDLTKLINKLMNVKYQNIYHVNERDGKDLKYTLNSNKIRKKYSWSEKTNLEQGIINTIDWVKENFNYLKESSLNYIHKK